MKKSQINKCQCVDGNHTCGKAAEPGTGEAEHLRLLVGNVQVIDSVEENVPAEQISTEFMESGAYANYPYICTPTIPDADIKGLSESTAIAVVRSCDDCPECDRASSNFIVVSNTRTVHATDAPEDQSPLAPNKIRLKKSTSPQRPTDINTGLRTTFHQFSGSEQDGILKSMEYAPTDHLAPTQRLKRTENFTEDEKDDASATGSSSDSRSQSTASDDTLTGSSGVIQDLTADATLRRTQLTKPKINIATNVEGRDAVHSLSTLSTKPSTENIGGEGKIKESVGTEDTDGQKSNSRVENEIRIDSGDMKVIKGGYESKSSPKDSEDISSKTPEPEF